MTIDPEGKLKGLRFKWEMAAYDLPIPSRLIEKNDEWEWERYIKCLSPAQQIHKFGQALDQFHDLIKKAGDPATLLEEDQIALYSKWNAAAAVSMFIFERLQFAIETAYRGTAFNSDIDESIFLVTDLLKSVSSPAAQMWEERGRVHGQISKDIYSSFLDHVEDLKNKGQKPSAGSAPRM